MGEEVGGEVIVATTRFIHRIRYHSVVKYCFQI